MGGRYSRALVAVALIAAMAIAIAGCGDDSGGETTVTTPPPPGTGADGDVKLQKLGDFDQPVFVAQPGGSEDLYVVEKPGRVRIYSDGAVRPTPALDISDRVSDQGEQGLLSIAFSPSFATDRLVYAYFTDQAGDQRVVEYRVAADGTIDAGSEREVLLMEDFASNHNGGLLLFGPDDHLYIGTGDGGLSGDTERNGQDLGSLLGKILRIDPAAQGKRPYGIPADNPFAKRDGARGEVFAYGLRNPWRFSFDPSTGALAIGDVGQSSLEEIDYLPLSAARGANFGWSAFEGTEQFNSDQEAPGHVPPILTYGREQGCSITGGYVVRSEQLPALEGRYLYGDFCAGELRSLIPTKGGAEDDRALGLEVPQLSSFAKDNQGRIYATSLDGPVFELVQ
jgi:glucose/arabinose dehydrogenase